jgi:alpha-galactosidase
MRDALYAAGRPVVFSLCEWGSNKPWEWGKSVGHLWRTTGDITNCWDCEKSYGTWSPLSVVRIIDLQRDLRAHAGPGHWNDPDMLEVGNGMTTSEDRAHFSMWAMLAAPLIAGNDLRGMSAETRAILTNREVVAVDQDALGVEAFRYSAKDGVEVWFKPLEGGDWAMAVLNRNTYARKVSFDWKSEKVADAFSKRDARFDSTAYSLRDLWAARDAGDTREAFSTEVPPHDVLMLRLKRTGAPK